MEQNAQVILAWAEMAGGYSLTRIYQRVRKRYGIDREDRAFRRWRPYRLLSRWPHTRLYGKHVVADRATALTFLRLLEAQVGPQGEYEGAECGLPCHSQEELGIIFTQLLQQEYGAATWDREKVRRVIWLMQAHLAGSWLPGDLLPCDDSRYTELQGLPCYRWVMNLLGKLYATDSTCSFGFAARSS